MVRTPFIEMEQNKLNMANINLVSYSNKVCKFILELDSGQKPADVWGCLR